MVQPCNIGHIPFRRGYRNLINRWQGWRSPQPGRHPGYRSDRNKSLSVNLMDGLMFSQICNPPKPLAAFLARELLRTVLVLFVLVVFVVVGRPGFVPASVRSQVGGTVEDFITLGAAILDVYYPGAPVLGQSESVFVELLAEATDVVAYVVLDFGEFGFGLFGDFDDVEGGIDVALPHDEVLVGAQLPDDGPGDRRAVVLVEVELPRGLVLLGGRVVRLRLLLGGHFGGGRSGPLDAGRRRARRRDGHLALQAQIQGVGRELQGFGVAQVLLEVHRRRRQEVRLEAEALEDRRLAERAGSKCGEFHLMLVIDTRHPSGCATTD
jgi:hypothetical protein